MRAGFVPAPAPGRLRQSFNEKILRPAKFSFGSKYAMPWLGSGRGPRRNPAVMAAIIRRRIMARPIARGHRRRGTSVMMRCSRIADIRGESRRRDQHGGDGSLRFVRRAAKTRSGSIRDRKTRRGPCINHAYRHDFLLSDGRRTSVTRRIGATDIGLAATEVYSPLTHFYRPRLASNDAVFRRAMAKQSTLRFAREVDCVAPLVLILGAPSLG